MSEKEKEEVEVSKNEEYVKPKEKKTSKFTILGYLANYSTNRKLDSVVFDWYLRQDGCKKIDEKTKEEWDKVIQNFYEFKEQ